MPRAWGHRERSIGLAVFGTLVLICVAVWAYIHHGNAGPAVLVLAGTGALFVYLGLTERQLSSFKAGGVEASLEAVVLQTLDDPNVPDRSKIVISESVQRRAASADLRIKAAEVLRRHSAAMGYERKVGRALKHARVDTWIITTPPEGVAGDFQIVDFIAQRTVYVEAKWTDQPADAERQSKWSAAVGSALNSDFLIVASALADGDKVDGIVKWDGSAEPTAMCDWIRAALSVPSSSSAPVRRGGLDPQQSIAAVTLRRRTAVTPRRRTAVTPRRRNGAGSIRRRGSQEHRGRHAEDLNDRDRGGAAPGLTTDRRCRRADAEGWPTRPPMPSPKVGQPAGAAAAARSRVGPVGNAAISSGGSCAMGAPARPMDSRAC